MVPATRRFFIRALEYGPYPSEVTTDRASAYPRVLDELLLATCHTTEQYASNPVEADHGLLKARPAAHARPETARFSTSDQYRARIRPEYPPGPLRTWCRC
jgi:transposase-like protein